MPPLQDSVAVSADDHEAPMLEKPHSAQDAIDIISSSTVSLKQCSKSTHSGICDNSRGLDLYHPLDKFDAAYANSYGGIIPSSKNDGFNRRH